jgi:siroheme synthase-like protein
MTSTFPVALKLAGRACVVVGNSAEALRRVTALLRAGAEVTLIASMPAPELIQLAAATAVTLRDRDYCSTDLDGKWLAVLCERNAELARRIARDAEQRQLFFCAIDQPAYNSFAHVGLVRSGPVFLAVGSEGKAPALSRRLMHELQRLIDDRIFSDFVQRLVQLRETTPRELRATVLNRLVSKLELRGRFVVNDD